jgi:hypothetical protein
VTVREVASRDEALEAAAAIGFPVALKTAAGHAHKSDVGGVHLRLADPASVAVAYDDLAARLGSAVLVAAMVPLGVEIGVGAIVDPSFGPLVVVSAGGTLIEILDDKVAALAPFSADEARRMVEELRIARLIAGARGRPPADTGALADAIARFSVLASCLADVLAEADVNPIIAGPDGALAVDALLIARKGDG